jgi:hypothetical protein
MQMKSAKQIKKKRENEKITTSASPADLNEMTHDELTGSESKDSSLESSSTDEDEDEGLGDGNIGRSDEDILGRD